MIQDILLFIVLMSLSYFSTGLFRKHALKKGLMDLPNERSSHTIPTPRGGGIVFVVLVFLIWSGMLVYHHAMNQVINNGNGYFLISMLIIGALGFSDDKYQLSAKFRLVCQFIAFLLFMYWLLVIPMINYHPQSDYGYFWYALLFGFSSLFLVWITNLYNFMDGIDGIAAAEAIFFLTSVSIFYQDSLFYPIATLTWILCPLLLGFMLWNFPKAKVFMGDVGSSFLGAFIGLICIYLATTSWSRFFVCVILLANFITDATLTLIIRYFNGDNIFQAHRTHAYQHASRYYGSHVPVTLGITVINIIWLLPWAYVAATGMLNAVYAAIIAYLPILGLGFLFDAGKKEIISNEINVKL